MKSALTAIALVCSLSTTAQEHYKVHILEEGETLSELLHRENYTPLYGEERWVEKILKANHLTMEQAKDIKTGRPIILPSKEMLLLMDRMEDKVALRQASISHGLFGNRISRHQNVDLGFQYHVNSLRASDTDIVSQENYGFILGYEDNNNRYWMGLRANPRIELGVITHGTNQAGDEVLSYDPTYLAKTKIELRAPSSTISFGPNLSWQAASRGYSQGSETLIRRDEMLWAGAFAKKSLATANNVRMQFEASIQQAIADNPSKGEDSLGGWKSELAFSVNLTRNYFLRLFSETENYNNNGLESASAAGARLSYQIQ